MHFTVTQISKLFLNYTKEVSVNMDHCDLVDMKVDNKDTLTLELIIVACLLY